MSRPPQNISPELKKQRLNLYVAALHKRALMQCASDNEFLSHKGGEPSISRIAEVLAECQLDDPARLAKNLAPILAHFEEAMEALKK